MKNTSGEKEKPVDVYIADSWLETWNTELSSIHSTGSVSNNESFLNDHAFIEDSYEMSCPDSEHRSNRNVPTPPKSEKRNNVLDIEPKNLGISKGLFGIDNSKVENLAR